MRTIIIEDAVYKVTEREFKVIKKMEDESKKQARFGHKQEFFADEKLNEYLDVAKKTYKYVGTVDFHFQR